VKKGNNKTKKDSELRRSAEKVLQETQERFRDFFENAPVGFHIFGPDRIITDINEAELAMTGYSREKIVGKKTWADLILSEQREQFEKHWKDIATKGQVRNLEYRLAHKDGHLLDVILNTSSRFDEEGKLINTCCSVQDITEQKRAQEAIALHGRAVFEATNGIVIAEYKGVDNPVIYVNPAFKEITGYSSEEIIGKDCRLLQGDDRNQPELEEIRSAIREHRPCEVVLRNYKKDGCLFWNELSISPVRDEKGRLKHFVGVISDITKRKMSEEEVEKLAKFPDENPNPVLRISSDGTIIYGNNSSGPLLEKWQCKVGEQLSGQWCKFIVDTLRGGKLSRMEVECDGQVFSLTFAPIMGADYVNVYGLDITIRKRAEEELLQSEKKYRLLFDANPHPMWVYDLESLRFLAVNDTAIRTYGYSREEFLAMKIKDICPAEDIPALLEGISNVAEGVDWSGIGRHMKKDGSIFFVETITHTIMFEGRRAEIVLSIDVTERKRAEENLAEERNLLRTLIDNMPDNIYVKDTSSRFLVANVAVARFMGSSIQEELISKTDHDFYEKELADEYRSDEQEIISTGKPLINKDEPKMGPGNKMAWVSTTKVPFRDSQGRIIGIVGISRNITERKEAENARDRLNRELALKNKELESILYAASHDLRTPLVNILGFSHELSQNCDSLRTALEKKETSTSVEKEEEIYSALYEAIPEALGYILTSAEKMDSLISGLLRLSRLGREAMKVEPLDMNLMMSDIEKSMEYQVKEAGAQLEIGTLPPCVGDASQINQVFSNLLDNAVKYLDKSRPGVIRVSGRVAGEQNIYCVEDNGVGIAPDHQEKIFEIFHRLQLDIESGEGLGLTIVRRILDKHKGSVWVESEQGKGSKFFVSLPVS
jgi:PAS domain S-box-containing protein